MKLFKLVQLTSTHRSQMGFISFMGGKSDINGNPKVAYFNKYFSESEAFSTTIVGQQSSLKDGFHFIHERETPYEREP